MKKEFDEHAETMRGVLIDNIKLKKEVEYEKAQNKDVIFIMQETENELK